MKRLLALLFLAGCAMVRAAPRPPPTAAQAPLAPAEVAPLAPLPAPRALPAGVTVATRTAEVESIALAGDSLWAATRGGLERYELPGLERAALYTSADGLPDNHVLAVELRSGQLWAQTQSARCCLQPEGFACEPFELARSRPELTSRYQGARVTGSLDTSAGRVVATAGAGLWLDGDTPRRLTPAGQLCGNHVTDVVEWNDHVWVATFDRGLCQRHGDAFRSIEAPFRFVNALEATPHGLFVAAGEGLFRSNDGRRFERVELVEQNGANGLAFDGRSLWATTPGALWRVRLGRGPRDEVWWKPGGSTAVQRVSVAAGTIWLATEDRGAIRFDGKRFAIFDRAAGMPSSWVVDVAAETDGSVLAATLRHGLGRVGADGQVAHVAVPDPWLLHVSRAGEHSFVGTQGGAFRLASGEAERFEHLPDPRVHVVARAAGELWIGTEGGLLRRPN